MSSRLPTGPTNGNGDEANESSWARGDRITATHVDSIFYCTWSSGFVYLFNAFNPKAPVWSELGSPEKLVTLDHDYFASIRGEGRAAGGALPHRDYQNVPTLNPASPKRLRPGETAEVEFVSGTNVVRVTQNDGSRPSTWTDLQCTVRWPKKN